MSPRTFAWMLAVGLVFLSLLAIRDAEARCHTRACHKRVHAKRVWDVCVDRHGGNWCTWRNRFRRLPAYEQSWVRCIAHFETFGIPWKHKARTNTGNGYYGSTQFLASTARAAGFKSRPDQVTLYEQLVRSVHWAHAAGRSQWSTNGRCT